MASKGFIAEFKEFISRGNVVDMAVGIIIGGAFTSIVTALVNCVIMPLIAAFIDTSSFLALTAVINGTEIPYGQFIQSVVNFLLTAFAVFIMVKGINSFRRKQDEGPEPEPEPEPSEEVLLLREIRDSLKK